MTKNNILSEKYIIDKFLRKLNFNKVETFDFKNDAAFIKIPKTKQLVVTNDTILESVDFFKNELCKFFLFFELNQNHVH